jgi:hypothetical protein
MSLGLGSRTYAYSVKSRAKIVPDRVTSLYNMTTQLEYFRYSASMNLPAIIDPIQKHLEDFLDNEELRPSRVYVPQLLTEQL